MDERIYKQFLADENIPSAFKERVKKVNGQLAEWDAKGNVRRDYAEGQLAQATVELRQMVGAMRMDRIEHMRTQAKKARAAYENDYEHRPAVAMLRAQDAAFTAEGLSDAQISGRIGSLMGAENFEAALRLFENGDMLKAVFREANRRNVPVQDAYGRLQELGLEPIDFTYKELPVLRQEIAKLEAASDDVFPVRFTRDDDESKSETINVTLESVIDFDRLASLPERKK